MWTEAWPSINLTNLQRSLKEVRRTIEHPDLPLPPEIAGYLTRFLVVRSCGYLEQVIDETCRAYLKSKSAPGAAAFGSSWLGGGRNPKPDALEQLLRRFNLGLETELKELFSQHDDYLRREIAFLVDRRNKIAHGLNENITLRKALELADAVTETADWFILRLDPRG